MPCLKIDIPKGRVFKTVPKATYFLRFYQANKFLLRQKMSSMRSLAQILREIWDSIEAFCVKSAKIPALSRSFRDTWHLCIGLSHKENYTYTSKYAVLLLLWQCSTELC